MVLSLRTGMWVNGWLRRYDLTEKRIEGIGESGFANARNDSVKVFMKRNTIM